MKATAKDVIDFVQHARDVAKEQMIRHSEKYESDCIAVADEATQDSYFFELNNLDQSFSELDALLAALKDQFPEVCSC